MSKKFRFSHSRVPLAIAAGLSSTPVLAQGVSSIQFTAEKTLLRADGRSSIVLTAKVFDNRGSLVPDGTIVQFTATAGRLAQSEVTTVGGVALVTFYAADQPGQAVVTASLQGVAQSLPSRLVINFSRDADNADTRTPWITIAGSQYTGYIADNGIVQAVGKGGTAEFTYRDLTIRANTIQYNARENRLLAVGNVQVTVGKVEPVNYNTLRYDFGQGAGQAERIIDAKPLAFDITGSTFQELPFAVGRFPPPRETWTLTDLSDAQMAVVASAISIEPGKQLQFRRATVYAAGQKTFTLPVHMMEIDQKFIFPRQLIGFSDQGISVDVPLYYDVRPGGLGTLHIRHSSRVGGSAYAIRPGWSVDAIQTYTGPQRTTGRVELSGLTRGDWGMVAQHAQRIGQDTSASLYFSSPNHRSLLFNPQLSHNFRDFYVNANALGSLSPSYTDPGSGAKVSSGSAVSGSVNAETYSRPIPGVKSLRYVLTGGLSRQHYAGETDYQRGDTYTSSLGTRAFTPALKIARNTTLTQSASLANLWVAHRGYAGNTLPGITMLATTSLNYSLGDLGLLGLNYNFTRTPSNAKSSYYGNGKHQLGLTGYLSRGSAWDLSVAGVQGLDVKQTSFYTNFGFRIKGQVRGRVTYQLTGAGTSNFSGMEYALTYPVFGREVTMYYSTTTRRVMLDFGTHF